MSNDPRPRHSYVLHGWDSAGPRVRSPYRGQQGTAETSLILEVTGSRKSTGAPVNDSARVEYAPADGVAIGVPEDHHEMEKLASALASAAELLRKIAAVRAGHHSESVNNPALGPSNAEILTGIANGRYPQEDERLNDPLGHMY